MARHLLIPDYQTMHDILLVSEERLSSLRATRQGRISLSGYNYQTSYAVARLASMLTRRRILGLDDQPTMMRYDWGEDLDELADDGRVCFTQCKRVPDIGRAGSLAAVLLGFAPKWLWASEAGRDSIRFRIVCNDKIRLSAGGKLVDLSAASRNDIASHFSKSMRRTPSDRSDQSEWQQAATEYGVDKLFDEIWARTEVLYLPAEVAEGHPAGPLLPGEEAALNVLLQHGYVDSCHQRSAIHRLRGMIHTNLVEFDPTSKHTLDFTERSPRLFEQVDVALALTEFRERD